MAVWYTTVHINELVGVTATLVIQPSEAKKQKENKCSLDPALTASHCVYVGPQKGRRWGRRGGREDVDDIDIYYPKRKKAITWSKKESGDHLLSIALMFPFPPFPCNGDCNPIFAFSLSLSLSPIQYFLFLSGGGFCICQYGAFTDIHTVRKGDSRTWD